MKLVKRSAPSSDDLILLDDEGDQAGHVRIDDSSYGRKWGSYQLHLRGDFYPTTHRSTREALAYARKRSSIGA